MTPATALRIARDEWPALRWRLVYAIRSVRVVGGDVRAITRPGWLYVSTDDGYTWRHCPDARSFRRALRAARYALADV